MSFWQSYCTQHWVGARFAIRIPCLSVQSHTTNNSIWDSLYLVSTLFWISHFSVRFPRSHSTRSTVIRILEMYVLVWCRIFISKCLGHFLPEISYWLVLLSWATGPIELLRRVYKSQYGCRWCAGDIGSQFACIIFYCSPKTNYRNQEPITITAFVIQKAVSVAVFNT